MSPSVEAQMSHSWTKQGREERIRMAGLIRVHVCRAFEVDLIDFAGSVRVPRVVWCRRLVALLAREFVDGVSWPEIALAMGRPTHSTLMDGVRRFREEMARDPEQVVAGVRLRNLYLRLQSELKAKFAEAA